MSEDSKVTAEAEATSEVTPAVPREKIPDHLKVRMTEVLKEYAACGVIGSACHAAQVPTREHSKWMVRYPAYAEKIQMVKERFIDGLELVAISRAKEKSDSLLQLMLKSHRREVYGDKSELELAGKGGKPMVTLVFNENLLTDEEKQLLGANVPPDYLANPPVQLREDGTDEFMEDEFDDSEIYTERTCDPDDDPDFEDGGM